jgi:small G protein signaling modulator 3
VPDRGSWRSAKSTVLISECSGAKDLFVPGEYMEILEKHADEDSPVAKEIEKDVSRTFPGNVFFGT